MSCRKHEGGAVKRLLAQYTETCTSRMQRQMHLREVMTAQRGTCCAFPSATSFWYLESWGERAGPAGRGCPATAAPAAASGAGADSGRGCFGAGMNSAGCTTGARALASALLALCLILFWPLHDHACARRKATGMLSCEGPSAFAEPES